MLAGIQPRIFQLQFKIDGPKKKEKKKIKQMHLVEVCGNTLTSA